MTTADRCIIVVFTALNCLVYSKDKLPHANFHSIAQSAAELWPKTTFKTADVRHLEF